MKGLCKTLAAAIAVARMAGCLPALAVPRYWEADVRSPAAFQTSAWQGETVELAAQLVRGQKPFAIPEGATAGLWWKTNGMDRYWGPAPATVSTNGVVSASWTPTNDVGAASYRGFLGVSLTGDGSNLTYAANFTLRMLESPGFAPNSLPLPVQSIDFSLVEVSNAPWIEEESDPTVPAWAKAPAPPAEDDPRFSEWLESGFAMDVDAYVSPALDQAMAYTDAVADGLSPTGHVHDAADIASGTLSADRIPPLAASKITSGTLAAARIPGLAASKITSGTLSAARLPAATASDIGAAMPDGETTAVSGGVLSARPALDAAVAYADGATNGLAAAVGAMMARIAAWGSPYESPLLSSLGPAGSEGPTVYTRGGESEISVSFWMRYQPHTASTNQAAGLVPGYWSAFCIPQLSMAPARATREGGAALEAFLDVADVPLGASGAWSTNCIPQDAATQEVGGHGDRFVVCANVVADTGVRLSLGGGEPVWFPASNGVRQVRNVLVAPGDPSVSVLADDPGGSVSLALAVNPWVEFKCLVGNVPEYKYGDGGRGMDGPVQVTNSFVHVVGRLRLSPGGGLDAMYTLRNLAGGAMSATGAVSTAFSSGSFPADVRLRHVWGALAGGFGGFGGDPEAVAQRFAPTSAPVWWTDAEVDDLYLRGLRELRARGLDRPLPNRGAQ